jgi:hypothetical protein
MVVGHDGCELPGTGTQVAARDAEVVRRGHRRVVDVERIRELIAIAVHRVNRPRRRNELHRSYGTVVYRVTVHLAIIGVMDERGALAVQRNADHGGRRGAVCAKQCTTVPTVIGLDPADRGKQ